MPTTHHNDKAGLSGPKQADLAIKRLFRVTIATALPPAFGATFDDFTIEAGSAEEARAQFEVGPWQVISDVIAVEDIPARIEEEKAEAARVAGLPASVARRAADAARLEKQRATSRAANARRSGGQSATAAAVKSDTFNSIPVGAVFRWRSNLGGGDAMKKVSATHLRNLSTGNEYAPTRAGHYFGPDDSVIVAKGGAR